MHRRHQATPVGRWIVAAISVALVFAMQAGPVRAAAIEPLVGCTTNSLPANDDGSTGAVELGFTADFFGTSYSSLYINNNGNVTFGTFLGDFTPEPLVSAGVPIIAPFWADVDTTGTGSGVVSYGQTTFDGHPALCVDWDGVGVGYFAGHYDKLNKFQLLLVGRADVAAGDFDILFDYDQVQWETGDASGGSDGLGGISARAGYSNGDPETPTTSYELPGSAVNGAFLDSNTSTGLVYNSHNSGVLGRYIYPVRNGTPDNPDDSSGFATGSAPTTVQTAPDGLQFSIITVPVGVTGPVTMHEFVEACQLPNGTTCIGQTLDLTAPSASATNPLVLKILVAKNAVSGRLSAKNAVLYHTPDGGVLTRVPDCAKGSKRIASPAPTCLSGVSGVKVGGVRYWQYLVYTVDNGSWRPGK